jgi:hypothetical protein
MSSFIKDDYTRLISTKEQLTCNAIRDMFFHRTYNKRVPKKDVDIMLNSPNWNKVYGNKNLKNAWKRLVTDGYINGELNTKTKEIIYIWGIENNTHH